MSKNKICKEVRYSPDEWEKVIAFSKKCGKLPSAYIREKAVSGKILFCDVVECTCHLAAAKNDVILEINKVAKTVNTEKVVFQKDVEDVENAICELEDLLQNQLKPFIFKEVQF